MPRFLLPVMTLVSLRNQPDAELWPGLRDKDDTPVWTTAVVAGAQYVVSQNVVDFPPLVAGRHAHGGVEYLTALEFAQDVLCVDPVAVLGRPLPQGALIRSRRTRP